MSRTYFAVGTVAIGVYFLLPDFVQNLAFILIGVSAGVAILVGVKRHRPDKPLAWYALAGGILMFVVGETIRAYYENVLGVKSPFSSAADGFYLAGYPFLAAGLAYMAGFRAQWRDRSSLTDVAIVAAGAGLISWVFLIEPYVPALPLGERLIYISYTLGDVFLVTVAAGLLFKPGPYRPAYYLLASSLVLFLITDILYVRPALTNVYETGSLIDAGWLLAYLLLGTGALHPSMTGLSAAGSTSPAEFTGARWMLLSFALALGPITLLLHPSPQDAVNWPVIVFGVALIILVLARMGAVVRSRERAISRERILRDAGTELVRAPDREHIYAATLEAILPFIKEAPGTRVSVWSGSSEKDRCVAAAGHRAEDVRGKETYISDFPDWLRASLLEGKTVDLKPGQPTEVGEAFRFVTKVGAIFMAPLMVRGRFEGRIAVASDSQLPGDIRYVLETLGSQVALALERNALAGELYQRRGDERFRKLVQNSSDLITMLDTDSSIQYISPSVEQVLGYGPEEKIGLDVFEVIHPGDRTRCKKAFAKLLRRTGSRVSVEARVRHRDGSWRHMEAVATNFLGVPDIGGLVLNSRDITGRKQAEDELRKSEERFRTLFEYSVDTLLVHDEEGRILDCNAEACRALGYTREELLSLRVRDIATGPLSDEERREQENRGGTLWQRVVRGDPDAFGTIHYGEHKRKDGTAFPVEVHVGAVDYDGRRLILASVRDITERREFEKRLQENEQRYRSLFDYNPDAVYSFDLEGNFLTANAACETLTGYPVEELLRMSFVPLIVPEHLEVTLQSFERAARGEPRHYENAITRKDGRRVELNATKLPIIVDGEIVGVYGIAKDITGRKLAEAELRESEARFRTLFDQTAIGACVADLDRRLIETNLAYQEITGYSGEELVGMSTLEITHPDDRAGDTGVGRTFVSDEFDSYQREKRYVRKDGEIVWAKATSTLVQDESGEPRFIMGVVEDVTDRRRADEELREAEERFRGAFDEAATGMALIRPRDGGYVQVNAALCGMLSRPEEELLASTFKDITHPEDVDASVGHVQRIMSGDTESYQLENRYLHRDGHTVWVYLSVSAVRDTMGYPQYLIAHMQNITEQKQAGEALRESEERYRAVVERATDGIHIYDFSTKRILKTNTALQNMLGYTSGELLGREIYDLIAHARESIARNGQRIAEEKSLFLGERRYRRKDGSPVYVEASAIIIPYEGKEAVCTILRDVTERKALREQLSYQAFHDSLTGLPNRLLFTERLEHALARTGRGGNRVAVLFVDLDNFKDVNDSLGHDTGDRLLVSVANLLREVVRPGDTVGRFGGDELNILLEEVADTREATRVAERIKEALQAPITVEGHEIFVSASIGITTSDSTRDRPERLLSQADLAMYRAKNSGKSQHEVFTPGMETESVNRLQLGNDLRRAVEQNEFRVCYQPKVRLDTDFHFQQQAGVSNPLRGYEIAGMEALVRWEHPDLGTLGPKDFISTAEETGLILPIGHGVLEEACRQTVAWRKRYPAGPPLIICVNLSARQFQHPRLAQDIERVLRETGLDPACLELEITESVVMEEAGTTLTALRQLRSLGVGLAIDDFGTGYSSLSYLRRFPVDFLKIDRSFVEGIGKDEESEAITSGIVTLAHTLGIKVVAEGVENAGQAARLRRLGCDMAQGNYFSEPLPGEAAGGLLAATYRSARP